MSSKFRFSKLLGGYALLVASLPLAGESAV